MENQNNEKNQKMNKDLSNSEEITITIKIFHFFYYVLRKKDINMFLCCFLLLLETLQMISYAFTTPHQLTWKINTNTMDYL